MEQLVRGCHTGGGTKYTKLIAGFVFSWRPLWYKKLFMKKPAKPTKKQLKQLELIKSYKGVLSNSGDFKKEMQEFKQEEIEFENRKLTLIHGLK